MREKQKRKKAIDSSWNVPVKKTEVKPPSIPKKVLNEFLEKKIRLKDIKNVSLIEDGFLWTGNNTQRYRINVWVSEEIEGQYCLKHYIKYSFFVHYDKVTETITDKTVAPKPDKDKIF